MSDRSVVEMGKRAARRGLRASVEHGLPPSWVGYRWMRRETVADHVARVGASGGSYQTLHPEAVESNPLPLNVDSREELPEDPGWWGFSFRDVPRRVAGETFVATIPDATVVSYHDPQRGNDFYPAIASRDGRALDLREIRFRPRHAPALRAATREHVGRAVWVLERSYANHSHWLTAHLPKLLLARSLGCWADVALPRHRTRAMDDSMRMLGLEPDDARHIDLARPLDVEELTVIGSDRFRPEMIRLLQDAVTAATPPVRPQRRVYVSRSRAARRRLLNEDEVWPLLADAGFEKVHMEDLSFGDQVALMRETAVLCGPHGAGLTNMVFCPTGTEVIEIADLGFPNPNFYALACAAGHRYRLVRAAGHGDAHPLERDMTLDTGQLLKELRHATFEPA